MGNSTCSVASCELAAKTRGMCNRHYQMQYRGLDPEQEHARRAARAARRSCSVEGCDKADRIIRGYCNSHYHYWKRTGQVPAYAIKRRQAPICKVDGCDRSTRRGGLDMCGAHYQRFKKDGHAGHAPIQSFMVQGPICSINGCDRPTKSFNLCDMHYKRQWKGNDPALEPDRRVPVEDRFWSKIDKAGPTPPHCPELGRCWVWTAGTNGFGYGSLAIDGGHVGAHRVSWELHCGRIPDDLHVLHKCDNPPCVRPDHLFVGTPADNSQDMSTKGRAPGSRKLTWRQVDEIRAHLAAGFSRFDIAPMYDVTPATIWCIAAGKTWDPAKRRSMDS